MKTLTLEQVTNEFVHAIAPRIRNKSYGKVDITNTLIKQNTKKATGLKKEGILTLFDIYHSLLDELEYADNLYEEDTQIILVDAIEQSFRSYPRSKNSILKLYQDFILFIQSNYNIVLIHELPNGRIPETPLERQIKIIKLLHHNEMSSAEIAEALFISERAVTGYLTAMSSAKDDEGLILNEEKIKISFNRTTNKYKLIQTLHPVTLAPNLRQVIVILEGLRLMCSGEDKLYAYEIAQNIYNQLSLHGKDTLAQNVDRLQLQTEWYSMLEEGRYVPQYRPERQIHHDTQSGGDIDISYFIKSNRLCRILYLENAQEKVLLSCKIIGYTDSNRKEITITQGEKTQTIASQDILEIK